MAPPPAAAATTTTFVLIFMLHSSLLLIHAFAPATDFDCTPARSYHPNPPLTHNLHYSNRKILMGVPKAQPTRPFYGVELRDVPSGPDPLHHSGSPQKRPRISP